jgi:hypothetical protein
MPDEQRPVPQRIVVRPHRDSSTVTVTWGDADDPDALLFDAPIVTFEATDVAAPIIARITPGR